MPFATTRWSLVVAAGARESPEARRALEQLCEQYWTPLYAFVRHLGRPADEARDVVQSFILDLLARNILQVADRTRGRFRSFLLGCLKNFLAHEVEREQASKRGGARSSFHYTPRMVRLVINLSAANPTPPWSSIVRG